MICWITGGEGISFKVEARDPDEAFELLARSMRYLDYQSMCKDLGYQGGDFNVAIIKEDRGVYDADGNLRDIEQQEENIVVNAFKHLRRVGAQ